jgi:hypothetical protein
MAPVTWQVVGFFAGVTLAGGGCPTAGPAAGPPAATEILAALLFLHVPWVILLDIDLFCVPRGSSPGYGK